MEMQLVVTVLGLSVSLSCNAYVFFPGTILGSLDTNVPIRIDF